ncbi:MAG: hypothetical protein H3C31_02015 [Brumimicrobium sp.]|nr:hypothetical protein [Brumimicrobium sp.]MCO5269686.1 hypothetical protein [Brumimicrobium sp.]
MIKQFASNNPLVLTLIPVLVLVHLVLGFYFPNFSNLMEGSDNLWNIDFYAIPMLYSKIIAFFLICGNAFLLNYIFNSIEFYDRLTFIPSILYISLLFLFPISLQLSEDLISHLFFIIYLYHIFKIKQNDDARNSSFLAGFFLGISASFLPVFSIFLILIHIALIIIRPFSLREHLLPSIGFIIPFLWIPLVNMDFLQNLILFRSQLHYSNVNIGILIVTIVVVGILIIIAHKKILERRFKSSIHFRKMNSITLIAFFLTIFTCIFILGVSDSYFYITISVTVLPFILSYAFLDLRIKWVSYILFYCLLAINVIKFFV